MSQIEGLIRMVEEKKSENPRKRMARIITVASGKGGVGKSNISVNTAISYARIGKRVLLMDADLGLANVNILLGVIPKYTLYDVIKGEKTIKEILIPYRDNIWIIPGASGFYQVAELRDDQRKMLVSNLEELDNFDVVIVDAGAGISNNVLSFIAASNEVLVVTTPEPTSLTDAYGMIKAVVSQSADVQIKLVINMIRNVQQGKKVYQKLSEVCQRFLGIKIENLGYVFEDEALKKAVSQQKPVVISYPDSKATQSIEHLVLRLEKMDHLIDDRKGVQKFMKKLFSFYIEG